MSTRFLLTLGGILLAVSIAPAQPGDTPTGGDGTLYLGSYPNQITVVDEATEQVVAAIPVSVGVPRSLSLSEDRSRLYMIDSTLEWFEAIDIVQRKTIETFTLSDESRRARIRAYRVHPDGRHVVLLIDTAVKLVDRFEIEPRKLLLYDMERDEVVRELAWPTDNERGVTRMLFSPDGQYLYYFDRDVVVLETEGYTAVDRWAISEPIESGLGRLSLDFAPDLVYEEPGFFTGLFQVQDETQDRELMGIARIDLADRAIDFYTLGPAMRMAFALAPGRAKAYGLVSEIGHYEFWAFDLEERRIVARQPFPGRPRMDLHVSTNGRILYISQAGNTIDLYDAASFQYLRTITLEGDQTAGMVVVP